MPTSSVYFRLALASLYAGQWVIWCGLDLKVELSNIMVKIWRDIKGKDQDDPRFDI